MKPHQFQTLTGPKSRITIDIERKVFFIHTQHRGFELGFSHCLKTTQEMAEELNLPPPSDPGLDPVGLEALYLYYWKLFDIARRGGVRLPNKFPRTKSVF